MATSQWRNAIRRARGANYQRSANPLTCRSREQKAENLICVPRIRNDAWSGSSRYLQTCTGYKPLTGKDATQLKVHDFDGAAPWKDAVGGPDSRLQRVSAQETSKAILPKGCFSAFVVDSTSRLPVRSHQMFGDILTRRHGLISSPSFTGGQLWRGYATSKPSSNVSPASRNPSTQRTVCRPVDWAPELPLYLQPQFRGTDEVGERICWLWDKRRQMASCYEQKVALRDLLMRNVFHECELTIVGSSASGFGFNDSDVDMCLQFKSKFLPVDYDAESVLQTLKHRLNGEPGMKDLELIRALVPILSFKYKPNRLSRSIKVEINMNSSVGIINTQLLYAYSRMDCRVAPFILGVKRWATVMGIRGASRGALSSYSLTLLMLYFLQMQGVVPVLHNKVPEFADGRGFPTNKPLLLPSFKSENKSTLGELFKQMLAYYSDFDFPNNCVSIRDGTIISKEEALARDPDLEHTSSRIRKNANSRSWWKCILVQEPFNFTNTARSVYSEGRLNEIRNVFRRSHEVIHRQGGAKVLFH